MFRTGWWHNLVDVAGHVQDRQTVQRRVNGVKVVALQQEFQAAQITTHADGIGHDVVPGR